MPAIASQGLHVLTSDDVEFDIAIEPEQDDPAGHFASGDDAADAATVREINDQRASGNDWAWCAVKVTARWNGFEASDYLGGCSYASEAEFREPGGYFDDMKERALEGLNAEIAAADARLAPLRAPNGPGKPATHFVYGSGAPGCLYDNGPHFAETVSDAIESLLCVFGDSLEEGEDERLRANLKDGGYHRFENPGEAGAYYCEVSEQPGPCPEDDQ